MESILIFHLKFKSPVMKKTLPILLLIISFCFYSTSVFSQKKQTYYQSAFKTIDSLALATKPKEAVPILNKLIEKACMRQNLLRILQGLG